MSKLGIIRLSDKNSKRIEVFTGEIKHKIAVKFSDRGYTIKVNGQEVTLDNKKKKVLSKIKELESLIDKITDKANEVF